MHNRHRGLTTLALTVVLLLGCATSPTRPPTNPGNNPPAPNPTPDNAVVDSYADSCNNFNYYALTTGVTVRESGKPPENRPGVAGATGGDFDTVAFYIPPHGHKVVRQRYEGHFTYVCHGKRYVDVDCPSSCKWANGRGTDCQNVEVPTYYYLTVQKEVTATFTANLNIHLLRWNPPANISTQCRQMKDAWDNQVLVHEQHHLNDQLSVVAQANAKWQKGRIFEGTGEGATANIAIDAANLDMDRNVGNALDEENRLIQEEIRRKANEFHTEDPHVQQLDCSQCQ